MLARRRAFTFIELIVVVGLIGVGVALLPAPLKRSREAANRVKCMSNLRQIYLLVVLYAQADHDHVFPRTKFDPNATDQPTAYTKPDSVNPFADDGPGPNDVTAAMFLLLRTQNMSTDLFICPSSGAERMALAEGKSIQNYSNFDAQTHLSYSLSNPYPSAAAIGRGFGWNTQMASDTALVADMNPGSDAVTSVKMADGPAEQQKANSPNHQREGQNVMYADGHVEWSATVFAGAQQDNIFAFKKGPDNTPGAASGGIVGSPVNDIDSVMLPTFDATVKMPNADVP